MKRGKVLTYRRRYGLGLIGSDDGFTQVFFTSQVVDGGDSWIYWGRCVEYELFEGKGTPEAKIVKKCS